MRPASEASGAGPSASPSLPPRRRGIGASTKLLAGVAIVTVVAAAIYVGYTHSSATNACAGVSTPVGPSLTTSVPRAAPDLRGADLDPFPSYGALDAAPSAANPAALTGPAEVGGPVIPVVAAENFWGSLVAQLGGIHTSVTSLITDPNTDPHEYESNDSDAIAIKDARYVILNDVGYDDWASGLIAADGSSNQTVLNIGNMLGTTVGGGIVSGNPHQWYSPTYVMDAVGWMYDNLTTIAPTLTPYFAAQYENLTASLTSLYAEVATIKSDFAGTVVASTESIFVYLANATGLDLVSPAAFMEAVAEGNDPPDPSVVTFQCQLESGHVRVLVVNAQTVTPLTTSMKTIAQSNNVSVISVTETIVPPTATFQQWMGGELNALYVALEAPILGE